MLGLDVHDCAHAREQEYRYGKLREGMVLTIEPGLYFQPDDATVPERFRGIGVRIEDDVAVTAQGPENLSAALPSQADDVEAWIASLWRSARLRRHQSSCPEAAEADPAGAASAARLATRRADPRSANVRTPRSTRRSAGRRRE